MLSYRVRSYNLNYYFIFDVSLFYNSEIEKEMLNAKLTNNFTANFTTALLYVQKCCDYIIIHGGLVTKY